MSEHLIKDIVGGVGSGLVRLYIKSAVSGESLQFLGSKYPWEGQSL